MEKLFKELTERSIGKLIPNDPRSKEVQMIDNFKKAFADINSSNREALIDIRKHLVRDISEHVLFIFYCTGYGCKQNLGHKNETINASTECQKEILLETVCIYQVLVIHGCCYAAQQKCAKKKRESCVRILQLSSYDKDEKTLWDEHDLKGSYFTDFVCKVLQGDNFVQISDANFIKLFKQYNNETIESSCYRSHCEDFCLSCVDCQSVTLSGTKEFITRHFRLIDFEMKELANNAVEIQLGYFKPEKSSISIYLKESINGDMYSFSSDRKTMSSLKQSIIIYTGKSEESATKDDEDEDEIGMGWFGQVVQRGKCRDCNECFAFGLAMKCEYCSCATTQCVNLTYSTSDTGSATSSSRTILTEQNQLQCLAKGLSEKLSMRNSAADEKQFVVPSKTERTPDANISVTNEDYLMTPPGEIILNSHNAAHVTMEDRDTEVVYCHSPQQDLGQNGVSTTSHQKELSSAVVQRKFTQSDTHTVARSEPGENSSSGSHQIGSIEEMIQLLQENADTLKQDPGRDSQLLLWDFAGHQGFYTTHQKFLTSQDINYMVTDVSRKLTDQVDVACYSDREGIMRCRVHELIEGRLNSIHCHAPSPEADIHPVILVETHVDMISQKQLTSKGIESETRTSTSEAVEFTQTTTSTLAAIATKEHPKTSTIPEYVLMISKLRETKCIVKSTSVSNMTDPVVPEEILRMDDKSLQLYKKALQDGKEKVYSVRVMVVGHYGFGKTTLIKRLLGQHVDISERKSTEEIDVYTHCSKISQNTGKCIAGKTTLAKCLFGQQVDISERKSTKGIVEYIHGSKISQNTGEWIVLPEGPAIVSKNDKTDHSMRFYCSQEEDAHFYKCVSYCSERLSLASVKDPMLSATDNQRLISVSVPVKEDLHYHVSSRCKTKTRILVVRDLNISERDTGDLLLTCKERNLEDAVKFEDSVCTSVKAFFKTNDVTFDQDEDSNETEQQIQYGVDDIASKENGSTEIDERNVRDIDLKEKKKSILHGIICPPLNQLPMPSLSRNEIVGFVEGQSQITKHAELREILIQLASDEIPEPQITMKYDMLRLCTMKHFPGRDRPFAIRITGAGFYYAGHQDQVICYCCGSRKDNWVVGDIPLLIHQNMAPNCSFLTDNAAVNVPIRKVNSITSASAEVRLLPIQISDGSNQSDTAHAESSLMLPSNEQYQVKVSSETHQMLVTNKSSPSNQLMSSGRQNVLDSQQTHFVHAKSVEDPPPKYPQYAVKNMRINSFQGWSAELRQKPEEMADCGFYYAGFSDCVRCFYCGVGLRHWMSEDDPWIEHARWSTSCVYVRKMKGEEFVSLVKMAVEIAEKEEAASNNGGANHPPQNNSETAPINTEKEDFHCNNSTNSNTARDSACSTGTTGSAVGGAAASTPSHGNAEIQKYLLTDAAQSVIDMGYQPKMVLRAIEKVLMTKGTEELTGQIIMEALFEIEEQNKPKSQPQPSPQSAQKTETSSKANDSDEESNKQDRKQDGEAAESGTGEGLQIDPEKIRREHKELQEVTLCKICLDNTSSVVFLPCGHLVTCSDCAPAMRKCPICRTLIKGTVKTFFG